MVKRLFGWREAVVYPPSLPRGIDQATQYWWANYPTSGVGTVPREAMIQMKERLMGDYVWKDITKDCELSLRGFPGDMQHLNLRTPNGQDYSLQGVSGWRPRGHMLGGVRTRIRFGNTVEGKFIIEQGVERIEVNVGLQGHVFRMMEGEVDEMLRVLRLAKEVFRA